MRFFKILALLSLLPVLAWGVPRIERLEPAFWWCGMQNPTLQIMVYGPGIADAQVSVDYPGVMLREAVRLKSNNYLFLYLNLADNVQPGRFDLRFTQGKKRFSHPYELKKRELAPGQRGGFDASDVLYLIMPDRFADGDPQTNVIPSMRFPAKVDRSNPNARHGGDLQGIEQHLDYIRNLGVTAIWLNPVLENDMPGGSYHGYATTDYYKVDPRFGTNAYYKELIEKCHRQGLKVVMDMIFNHCGNEHVWFLDPPSDDWFNFQQEGYVQTSYRLTPHFDPYVSQYDKEITVKGWFVESMPDLNQHNPHLMKYLTQNSIWWIEYAGIDGIRMDTHPYVFFDSMADWCADVMREYPRFNIVGECWYGTEAGSAWWQRGSILHALDSNLKSVMDFPLQGVTRDAFTGQTDAWKGLNLVYDKIAMDFLYPHPTSVLTFLDNHDTDRFLLTLPDNLGFYKQAVAFLLTTRGTPQIYYGTEILMHGSKAESDGLIRLDFPGGFPGDAVNEFLASGRTPLQNEAFDFVQKVLQWRKGNEVIAKGDLIHFMPTNGIYLYSRSYNGKQVVVLMNGNDEPRTADMSRYAEVLGDRPSGRDVITGRTVRFAPQMEFAPRALYILEL